MDTELGAVNGEEIVFDRQCCHYLFRCSSCILSSETGQVNNNRIIMHFNEKTTLGRTGLQVCRLGIASGYWAPAGAIEEAFERGCNYMTWGTFIKGYSPHFREALRNINAKGQRDRLILSMFSYAHQSFLTEHFLAKGLKSAGLEYTDILILGGFYRPPSQRVIDGAIKLKEKGLVRFIGLSSHNRLLFSKLPDDGIFDIFHLRYNAAHRGAETDIFPSLSTSNRPGVVNFTGTAWGKLLNNAKMPPGETAPTAVDCYRFALSNPHVDVCMTGFRNIEQMRQNIKILEQGPMTEDELARMRRIGDHIYGRK
jgi:predicted aldo/keto reductase-like oxidoreductase